MIDLGLMPGACDTHIHVFRHGAPTHPKALAAPGNDNVFAYQAMREALKLTHAVVVQANAYGTDNSVAAEGIQYLGQNSTCGVAIVDKDTPSNALQELNRKGFCGARFHMLKGGILDWRELDDIANRVANTGWHVQLQLDGRDLPSRIDQVLGWPTRVVIDHIGKFLEPVGISDPAFKALLRLIDTGRVWVKLSAPYEVSRLGPPEYTDVTNLAKALVNYAPERMLWASNWPHVMTQPRPDDHALLDLLEEWAIDQQDRHRILCTNPEEVYGFKIVPKAENRDG